MTARSRAELPAPQRPPRRVIARLLVASGLFALATAVAQVAPALRPGSARHEPLPNFDRRAAAASRQPGVVANNTASNSAAEAALNNLRRSVPGAAVDRDGVVGAPAFVRSPNRFLAAAPASPVLAVQGQPGGNVQTIVGNFIEGNRGLFGHDSSVLTQARVRRDYVTRHNGLRTVVWEQRLDDIALFESTLQAHVTARGELVNIASRFLSDPARASQRSTTARATLAGAPPVSARQALALAGKNLGETFTAAQIAAVDTPVGAERKQRFQVAALNGAEARYVWLPMDADSLRLCWEIICTSKARAAMFRVLVDAESGDVMVRQSLTEHISNASYRVFTSDSPSPFSPGHPTPLTTQPPLVSRTLVTTMALNPTASPNGWIDDGVMETRGNNVDAHTDVNADDLPDLPRPQATGAGRVFDPALDLTQAPSTYRDAAVVNLFYWCNFMHDKLYELGFDEASGNFQNNNFGRGGAGNDAVQADAQDGSGTDNANFSTPPDGSPGRMQMYVFTGPTPDRDGDFDAEIILHEYTHGLSNRLVGGGVGMSALASRGMGEGWSDFYGLALLSEATDDLGGNYAAGGYATYQLGGMTTNYYFGIRRYPYSTDMTKNPLTFRDIDPSQAGTHSGIPRSPIIGSDPSEVHNSGEVWCVTLWEMRANLISRYGWTVGNQLALQLVTDGMKLSPANPNFLQARDAILQADLVANAGANRGEIWTAFAKRGMGANATAPSSSTTTGVVESFDLPDDLGVGPAGVFAATGNVGGPFTPASRAYTLSNSGSAPLTWTASSSVPWLTLSSTGGSLPAGGNTTVTASFNSAAALLAIGSYSGTLTFRNTTSGLAQTRTVQLEVTPFTVAILSEDFESGTLDSARWTITGTGNYRTQITTANGPHGGTRHLIMDQGLDSGSYARNEATLTVNLAGQRDVVLNFWAKYSYDEADGPPASPFISGADFDGVAISADGTNWYEVQGLRDYNATPPIGLDWTRYTVDLDAAIAAHGLSYNSTFKIRFNQYDNYAWPTDGIAIDDILVARIYNNQLAFNIASAVNENAAPFTATITATPAPSSSLSVSLTSSLPGTLTVPASVTIPAGQTSATFTVTPVDDALLNGTRNVTLTGTAATWGTASGTVAVQDNETATLTVSLPSTITEGAAAGTGTVTVSSAPAANVVVTLTNSDPASLQVPATVTILAGQTSVSFPVLAVDDNKINGTRSVSVTAAVANWTSGQGTTSVLDNESTALALTVPVSVREGDTGVTGTVRISGTLTSALSVALSSDDTTEITVPASVQIAAGQTSATFPITVVDDTLADGAQTAHITATASGFTSATANITVNDNDAHHFTISAISSPQIRGAPFSVSVTAVDVNNVPITNYNSTVTLSAAAGGSSVAITPASISGFVNGVWTGQITIGAFASGVVVTASDAGGHTGASNSFNVTSGPFDHFGWSGITSPLTVDTPVNVTLTAQDAGNNPVTFNGTVSLGVQLPSIVEVLSWNTYSDNNPAGEYQNTKTAISTYFTAYHETSTTVTDPAALRTALAGKHVFLVPEQELVPSGTMGALGTAWASVLTDFVNGGGTVIVCSYLTDEHMLLVNSGLMTATKGLTNYTMSLTKSVDTPLNAGVTVPFTGSYISQYAGLNADAVVSLQEIGGSPVVFSRNLGAGRVIMIGTDYFTLGTDMDRIVANAVKTMALGGGTVLPIRPGSANVVNGTWSGSISIPITGTGLKLAVTPAGGTVSTSSPVDVVAPSPPPSGSTTVFADDFESGVLSSAWTITGTGNYRTQITTGWPTHGGSRVMTMDEAFDSGSYARNEATLTLNLAGRTGVSLRFWATQFGDEYDGPPPSPFPGTGANFDGVAISADGGNTWYEIQPFNTLGYEVYSQFTLNLDAAIAARGLNYSSNFKIRFNQYDNYSLGTDGIGIDDLIVTANPTGAAFVVSVPSQATEGATGVTGSITLPAAVGSNTTFTLISSAPAKAAVPASIVVPSGQSSATFPLTLPDDTIFDGDRAVTITATATGYQPASGNLTVLDNDIATLALSVPASAREGDGSVLGTVTLSAPPAGSITVSLGSSVTSAATVPVTVVIPPGRTSMTFPITIVDDNLPDGTQTTTISASLSGRPAVTATLAVADNDPIIGVAPASISATVPLTTTITRNVTISNTGAGNLTWSIGTGTTLRAGATSGPVFADNIRIQENKATARPPEPGGKVYVAPRAAGVLAPDGTLRSGAVSIVGRSLADVLASLNAGSGVVRAAIPNRFSFTEGVTGNNFLDGGNDMYDGGNFLDTNLAVGSYLNYSDNIIVASAALGTGGQYFTRKYDGLWVFAADISGLNYFEITGNLGADGGGTTDTAVLTMTAGGTTYRGFVKRVYNAFVPSVNHMIIVPDNGSVTHEASTDTNNDYHRVTNLAGITRIYYLLYAGTGGALIDNTAAQGIMAAFLDATLPGFVAPNPSSGTVIPGATQTVTVTLGSPDLPAGTYTRNLQINSNDAAHSPLFLPITLTVAAVPALAVTPTTGFTSAGFRGGPFTPASQTYTLTNPGTGPINWTAAKTAAWSTLSASSGTLAAGASTTVVVSINSSAAALGTGSYTDSLVFTNTSNGVGDTTRPITLTVSPVGVLAVAPTSPLGFDGVVGGPFTPANASWTLTNSGDAALNWTAAKTQSWLTLSPSGGTLAAGASATVTAALNSGANILPIGVQHAPVTFTNTTSDRGTTARLIDVAVHPVAPALAAEPTATGGASNTVTWSPLPGSPEYEVQASNNIAFTSPLSSGWIAGTSHTFSPLTHGQTWYFRVRARYPMPAVAGAWSQTTQAEFDLGSKTNTVTTSNGDVVLSSQGFPIGNRILNASFESGTGLSITDWTQLASGQMGIYGDGSATAAPFPTNGSRYAELFSYHLVNHSVGEYCALTQGIDFTGVSTLTFDIELISPVSWQNKVRGEVRIDGVPVWSSVTGGVQLNQSINVSSYSGVHVLELRNEVIVAGTYDSQWVVFDNLRLAGVNAYAASGTYISPLIVPLPLNAWGGFQFNKDTTAAGTALTVDVLDAAGSALATGIASGVNLGGLPAVASQPALRFRANLSTSQSTNTPRLLDWGGSYTVSAPYFIESGWSPAVSSLQDAAAPVVAVTSPAVTTSPSYTLVGTATDDGSGVNALTINGTAAMTGNGFVNWTFPATLVPGTNSFTLVASDRAVPANVALSAFDVVYNAPGSPTISAHPQSTTANAGSAASLSVTASGNAPLSYQWLKNSGTISGATNATLSFASVQPADAGTYAVVVSNGVGTVTSNPATLTVISPPTITTHPQAKTIAAGQGFTFSVGVTGTAPFGYQWRKGGTDLSGATNATYGSTSAVAADAGSYTVVVSNPAGTATSNPAALNVLTSGGSASHAALGGGYVAGDTVTIDNTIVYAGTTTGLTWQAVLPTGWSYASSSGSNGDTRPTAGATGTIQFTWTTVPPNPVRFAYTLNVPSGTTGAKTITALVDVIQSSPQHLLADPDPLSVSPVATHSADTSQDYRISLVELTRVIELYNTRNGSTRTGCYAVQSGTEDGFAPDPARAGTATVTLSHYHSADANHDGKISLFELTRAIELYNYRAGTVRTGQYHVQIGTEDGFAPGP